MAGQRPRRLPTQAPHTLRLRASWQTAACALAETRPSSPSGFLRSHGDQIDQEWNEKVDEIRQLTAIDPLTRIGNRCCLDDYYACKWLRKDRLKPDLQTGIMPAKPTRKTSMFNPKIDPRPPSHAEYLEMEEASPVKHEYIAGQIYAMTGTSDIHNFICLNIASILRNHLKGSPCRVFMADVKAKLDQADAYYYPDVMVSCEKAVSVYHREQPCLIIEVLSESTAKFDTGDKRRDYQALPSLQEYVLVSQEVMDVRVWRRGEDGWTAAIYTDGAVIPLNSVDLQIPIEQIYEEVWA